MKADFRVVGFQEGQIGPLKTYRLKPVEEKGPFNGAVVKIGVIDPTVFALFPLDGVVRIEFTKVEKKAR